MSKKIDDLLEIIHFTEKLSTKIYGLTDKAEIYRTVKEEFAKSKKYDNSISLLLDGNSKLRVVETSANPKLLKIGEQLAGFRLPEYQIDLKKASIYSRVVKEGKTIQVPTQNIVKELFPLPLALLITKLMNYQNKKCILTSLRRQGKIIGVFVMTSTDLVDSFIPSVKSLAQHISNALELAEECQRRRWAEEKLRQLVESQKEFIASISHELRNPLSVIKALAEAQNENSKEARESFLLIDKKVNQITYILKNLLLLSRLDFSQEKLRKRKFKFRNLLRDVLNDVTREARQKNLDPKITFFLPKDIDLEADRVKVSIVLTNLLQNAIVHSNGQPQIRLKAQKLKDKVQIQIEDNNQPIPHEDLQKIFEKFYATKKKKRSTSGLGLGLYICKKLVELMGGKIWAESKKNLGNKFIVQLPA